MLKINNTIFTLETGKPSVEVILSEIGELPTIDLVFNPFIKAEEAVICLQQEIAYVDLFNPKNKIKYIGSKDVNDCILAYLHTETDHLVVHVDANNVAIDLYSSISAFTNKNKIDVYLVGGRLNRQTSFGSLKKIIYELYSIAIQLNINIEIKKQRILEHNRFATTKEKCQSFFNEILYKTNILSKKYFNDSIEESDFSPDLINGFEENDASGDIEELAMDILIAREYYDLTEEATDPIQKELLNFTKSFNNKAELINRTKDLFSKQGFNILNHLLRTQDRLQHFVFNFETKNIHIINKKFKTPNSGKRCLRLFDTYNKNSKYYLCYDGKIGLWNTFSLSQEIMNLSHEIYGKMNGDIASGPEIINLIQEKMGFTVTLHNVDDVACNSKHFLRQEEKKKKISDISFFDSNDTGQDAENILETTKCDIK